MFWNLKVKQYEAFSGQQVEVMIYCIKVNDAPAKSSQKETETP